MVLKSTRPLRKVKDPIRQDGNRRGSAMLFATMVMLILSMVGMALASTSVQALRMTRFQQHSSIAFNVAESGAERAILWLRQQPSPPPGTLPFEPFPGPAALGEGRYQVSIDPADENPALLNKRYLVRSTGTAANRTETLEVYLQLGSFGRYAYFTDYETSSVVSGTIYFKAGDVIDGPAHSNNSDSSEFNINWNGSGAPIFRDAVTSVAPVMEYQPRRPVSESEWERIYAVGSRGYRLGVNRIELPENTDLQKNAAWGAASGFPSATGVHMPPGSPEHGLYICGDCTMQFDVTPEGWQRITISQGSTTTAVTIRLDSDQTILQRGSTTTTYAGATNGVIYCTGHITRLSGELADSYMSGSSQVRRNAFTIATDVANGKNVTITNNLVYRTPPNRNEPWDSPVNLRGAALGLVARNVIIDSSAPSNLSLHGVMLAGGRDTRDGSFYVSNWDSKKSTGDLNLLGGVIQKKRGPVGTFNPSTGQSSTGYVKNYGYDQRMAVNPPPFFPTTGTYERLSFRRVNGGFASP